LTTAVIFLQASQLANLLRRSRLPDPEKNGAESFLPEKLFVEF